MRKILLLIITSILLSSSTIEKKSFRATILKPDDYKHYVDYFNEMEDENIVQAISNSESWEWMKENIPLFDAPQKNFEEMFYYRWWNLRKHIKVTPVGHVMTEFLVNRSYADKYNMIACAMGHHIMESRWLHNSSYLDEYIHVWYRGNNGHPMERLHKFSNWTADALYQKFLVDGDLDFLIDMLPDLVNDYEKWEVERQFPSGLFWQIDVQDGMEEQISGGRHVKNIRPTINSYMYANAVALSKIASLVGDIKMSSLYKAKAETLHNLINSKLWNPESEFFETIREDGHFAGVREAIGFIPWYFNLPKDEYSIAWKQLMDEQGFLAPYGQTTAERRHPEFRSHGCCNCEWDGAIWPFATSQTLTGLANLLEKGNNDYVSKEDYFRHLELYVESQYHRGRPYIGEYLDEVTGYWLKGDQERSRYYNHSTFNDLVISGLVGLRPAEGNYLEINPLLPDNEWDYFCLDNILYKGHVLTVVWDMDGSRYNLGQGLQLLVDGKQVASSDKLERLVWQGDSVKDEKSKITEVIIPIDQKWSDRLAQSMIKRSPSLYRKWGYMQGLLLTSFEELWKRRGDERYLNYSFEYMDDLIDDNGVIQGYDMSTYNLDDIKAGKVLFNLYKVSGDQKYKVAIETLRKQLNYQPRTSAGGFWHKLKYPWQMWLDGAYMASPFLTRYAKEFDDSASYDEAAKQLLLMNEYLIDPATGLLYHGWDESRVQLWSDPITGLSSNFWGRSIGWYLMAVVDVLDDLPANYPQRNELIGVFERVIDGVIKLQDNQTGLWYQVIDKGNIGDNYLESSASSMYVYVLAKALNKGYIKGVDYKNSADKGFEGILNYFIKVDPDGHVQLNQSCRVAGLSADRDGSFEYYVSEPVQSNDLKAIGPFILASLELDR